uniref:Uncharacterized protein n=1 Tax=Tetradesmus obliquus TaxID=3088 RepID=A0A383VCS4_TETOB|eukprot:jgi/Sobl393_1/9670/SZX62444.1
MKQQASNSGRASRGFEQLQLVVVGLAINSGRASRGFEQLQLVVVGLVGGGSDSSLSLTALREADAAAAAAGPASREACGGGDTGRGQ